MIRIRLAHDAADYVRRESAYLRERNPMAARKFALALKQARETLQAFPEAGNRMHGLTIAGGRSLVFGDYILDYLFDDHHIDIVAIRHGRMHGPLPDTDPDAGTEFDDPS
jgi:plasmid stabilization system protein ParE